MVKFNAAGISTFLMAFSKALIAFLTKGMSTAHSCGKGCFFSGVDLVLLATADPKVENADALVKKKKAKRIFSTAAWINCFRTILKGPSIKKKA